MKTKEAIEALERRADFLAKRLAEIDHSPGKPPRLHYDRMELGALRMAIDALQERWKEIHSRRAMAGAREP